MYDPKKEAIEILRRAAEVISPPGTFTKGALAIDRDGIPIDPTDPQAICFCSIGATIKVGKGGGGGAQYPSWSRQLARDELYTVWLRRGYFCTARGNDAPETKQEDAVGALLEAANNLEKE